VISAGSWAGIQFCQTSKRIEYTGARVKKVTGFLLFVVLGASLPLSIAAQTSSPNDAARIKSQKHNAKLSHKAFKAQSKQMKKAHKTKPAKTPVEKKTS
jgi:hypothetical protein